MIKQPTVPSLIDRQAEPGILILNEEGNTLYQNQDTLKRFGLIPQRGPEGSFGRSDFPKILSELYTQFRQTINTTKAGLEASTPLLPRVFRHRGDSFLLQPLHLQDVDSRPIHLMILIEPVSQGRSVKNNEPSTRLTPREERVVQLLSDGKTNKEVAVSMSISESTVKSYVKLIMKKLGVATRAAIVAKNLSSNPHRDLEIDYDQAR